MNDVLKCLEPSQYLRDAYKKSINLKVLEKLTIAIAFYKLWLKPAHLFYEGKCFCFGLKIQLIY